MPQRAQVLGLVVEGGEVSSSLGGSGGVVAACSITLLGGSSIAGASPR